MPKKKVSPGRPTGSKNQHGFKLTPAIIEFVEKRNKFTSHEQITSALMKKAKLSDSDRQTFSKKISVLLTSLKNQGRLTSYQGKTRAHNWGLPEWLKRGKPVEQYQF